MDSAHPPADVERHLRDQGQREADKDRHRLPAQADHEQEEDRCDGDVGGGPKVERNPHEGPGDQVGPPSTSVHQDERGCEENQRPRIGQGEGAERASRKNRDNDRDGQGRPGAGAEPASDGREQPHTSAGQPSRTNGSVALGDGDAACPVRGGESLSGGLVLPKDGHEEADDRQRLGRPPEGCLAGTPTRRGVRRYPPPRRGARELETSRSRSPCTRVPTPPTSPVSRT